MLSNATVFASFAVRDTEAAKRFYGDTVGLDVRDGQMPGIIEIGNDGSNVLVYQKPDHQPAVFTVLNIAVPDIASAVADLGRSGVAFEHYDTAEDPNGCRRRHARQRPQDRVVQGPRRQHHLDHSRIRTTVPRLRKAGSRGGPDEPVLQWSARERAARAAREGVVPDGTVFAPSSSWTLAQTAGRRRFCIDSRGTRQIRSVANSVRPGRLPGST